MPPFITLTKILLLFPNYSSLYTISLSAYKYEIYQLLQHRGKKYVLQIIQHCFFLEFQGTSKRIRGLSHRGSTYVIWKGKKARGGGRNNTPQHGAKVGRMIGTQKAIIMEIRVLETTLKTNSIYLD